MTRLFSRRGDHFNTAINLTFAFGAAVLIWAGVGARLTKTRSLVMPIEIITETGVYFEIVGTRRTARVTFAGPSALLETLASTPSLDQIYLRPKVVISASSLGDKIQPNYILKLDPTRDVKLPSRLISQLRTVSIEPAFLTLKLAPSVERVYPTAADRPQMPRSSDVQLESIDLAIDRVTVRGSLLAIEKFEAKQKNSLNGNNGQPVVKVRPFEIGNARGSFTLIRRFELPPSLISVPAQTEVNVNLKRAEELQDTRTFELGVCFLLSSPVKEGFIYELRPPRDTMQVTLTGPRRELDKFETQLKLLDQDRRPYAIIRVPVNASAGPQSGEIGIGNFNPEEVRIKGDKTTVYQIRKP